MTLPFKISAQNAGVRKAHARFVKEYGKAEGERIFLARANEQGTGKTARQKVISIYSKGSKLPT
jgi:hypothetical protein